MSCLSLTSKKMERVLYFEADISWPSYLSSCLSPDCAVFISFSGVFYAAFIFHLMNGLELIGDTKLFSRRKLSESSPLWELKRKLIYSSPSQSSLVPRTFPLAFKRVKRWRGPGNEVVCRFTFISTRNLPFSVLVRLRDEPQRLERKLSVCQNDYLMWQNHRILVQLRPLPFPLSCLYPCYGYVKRKMKRKTRCEWEEKSKLALSSSTPHKKKHCFPVPRILGPSECLESPLPRPGSTSLQCRRKDFDLCFQRWGGKGVRRFLSCSSPCQFCLMKTKNLKYGKSLP